MLKTGIISSAFFTIDDFESGMKKVREYGYDGVDYQELASIKDSPIYKMSESAAERYLIEVRDCAKANGVEIHQMHGVWPHVDDTTKEGREQTIEHIKRNIRDAKTLGCPRVVIHPCMPCLYWGNPYVEEEDFEVNTHLLSSLLPVAKEYGVKICFENMPFPKWSVFSQAAKIKQLVSQFNDEHIKVCLDTGHFNSEKKDIYETVCLLGSDLETLHVHDDFYGQDRHLIPYQGEIDWQSFLRGLKDISYKGCISLETRIAESTPEPMKTQMALALSGIARHMANEADK